MIFCHRRANFKQALPICPIRKILVINVFSFFFVFDEMKLNHLFSIEGAVLDRVFRRPEADSEEKGPRFASPAWQA